MDDIQALEIALRYRAALSEISRTAHPYSGCKQIADKALMISVPRGPFMLQLTEEELNLIEEALDEFRDAGPPGNEWKSTQRERDHAPIYHAIRYARNEYGNPPSRSG